MYWETAEHYFHSLMAVLSDINNIVQFIVSIIAAFTLMFILSNRRLEPLAYLFRRTGLKTVTMWKLLWLCRKNPIIDIRVFCEYCIIFSGGRYCHQEDWNRLYQDFRTFLNRSENGKYIMEIPDPTLLLSEKSSELIKKYFEYFSRPEVRQAYQVSSDEPICFRAKLKIMEGFLSPNFLLAGLISRYDANWHSLIHKYASACQNAEKGNILPHELYFTFAWLLWGPSYQIPDQQAYSRICQYAFGDENNSVPLILTNHGDNDALWRKASCCACSGTLCAITCGLYDPKDYIRFHRDKFNPCQPYFLNKLGDEGSHGFLLEEASCELKTELMNKNYYCTAYLWIMFEVIDADAKFFQPQKTLTFFEHANLACCENYSFLIGSLLDKVFAHFDSIFTDIAYSGRRYRFCLAMNECIEKRFVERLQDKIQSPGLGACYESGMVKESVYSAGDIFSAIDSYFSDISQEQQYIEVSAGDKKSLRYLSEFYTDVYIDEFPDPNERESFDHILNYLNKKSEGWYGGNNYHVLLLKAREKIVAGAVFGYFKNSNCGVIEFIAVHKDHQSLKLGSKLYAKAFEMMNQDARKARQKRLDYCICEIEKPTKSSRDASQQKYLYFWDKLGYKQILFPYTQPALDIGKQAVNSLLLIALPVDPAVPEGLQSIKVDQLKSFIGDYAKYGMRIEIPHENITIIGMYKELDRNAGDTVAFQRILY